MAMIQLRPVFGQLMERNVHLNERKTTNCEMRFMTFSRIVSLLKKKTKTKRNKALTQDECELNQTANGDGIHNENIKLLTSKKKTRTKRPKLTL